MSSIRLFNLEKKVAVVIGGGGGIGRACALGLADFGASIVVVDKNLKEATTTLQSIKKNGGDGLSLEVDVTLLQQLEEMVIEIKKVYGKIDILIHSVATTVRKPLIHITPEEWNTVLNVNMTSVYNVCKTVGQEFLRNRSGKMIVITSTGAIRAGVNFSAYGASKAGINHLIKSLALEWAPYKVNVNAIAPTATETPFTEEYYLENPDKKEATRKNHPYGRLGVPEDYVGAAVYLASSASDFVNGEVIVVDSGKTL